MEAEVDTSVACELCGQEFLNLAYGLSLVLRKLREELVRVSLKLCL